MVRIELSTEEAIVLRDVVESRLKDLRKEIGHTDHAEFKTRLRQAESILERVLKQLSS